MDSSPGPVSALDSSGNSYNIDVDVTNTAGVRVVILSSRVAYLPAGTIISLVHPTATARALSAAALECGTELDRTASGSGTGVAIAAGPTGFTSQHAEVVIGAIGVNGPDSDSFTLGTGTDPDQAPLGPVASTGAAGDPISNITLSTQYAVQTEIGAQKADASLTLPRAGAAALATYRLDLRLRPSVTVTPETGDAGTMAALTGARFVPGETVAVHWDGTAQGGNCDPRGMKLTELTATERGRVTYPDPPPPARQPYHRRHPQRRLQRRFRRRPCYRPARVPPAAGRGRQWRSPLR